MPPTQKPEVNQSRNATSNNKLSSLSNDEVDMIIKQIIVVQIEALEKELKEYKNLSSNVMHNVRKKAYLQFNISSKFVAIPKNMNKFILTL